MGYRIRKVLGYIVLGGGALVFLLPFYYMLVASLQKNRDPSLAGLLPWATELTFDNYAAINAAINLGRSVLNSLVFTAGVLVGTLVCGVLVGYALAQLKYRGQGTLFAIMLIVQAIPFQLLMVPLYVIVIRFFHLGDSYLGMIFPFAVNTAAVLVFRSYFLQLPRDIFDAARIDGAGEFRVLWSVALPLVRPALLTAALMTFIGPWNEFLWPFLITKKTQMQPLAVALANYLDNGAGYEANPFGVILAGSIVLAVPALVLFIVFQRYFSSTNLGSGVKG